MTNTLVAPVKWAQRKDKLFITAEVLDASDVKVNFGEREVTFEAKGKSKATSVDGVFKTALSLFGDIKPEDCSYKVRGPDVQICAIKKETGFWDKLVVQPSKETKSWLSCDWNLWKDEDEEDEKEKLDFGGMGGMGGGGYGDMAQMMQGMGGMGGMGGGMPPGMDFGAAGGDSDDEDEEEGKKANLDDLA